MSDQWKVQARHDDFSDQTEILIRKGQYVVGLLTLVQVKPGDRIAPTIVETREEKEDGATEFGFLRAALNCAWDLGLRPDGFNDTRESMAATKAHLQDMRALAFHKIGASKP